MSISKADVGFAGMDQLHGAGTGIISQPDDRAAPLPGRPCFQYDWRKRRVFHRFEE